MKPVLQTAALLVCLIAPAWSGTAAAQTTSPESVGISSARLAALDAGIEAEVASGKIAGLVVGIARRGEVVHTKAYGYANLETREAMSTDNLFRLYSMTKAVASVALLQLYEQGLFQLNDPLEQYIPAFANLKVYAGQDANGQLRTEGMKRKPTVLDAFRHTLGLASGVGQHPIDLLYREHGLGMGNLESLSEEMQKLGGVPLRYQPGEEWVYGLGHDVQAYLVEYFSGMSYQAYLQQHIFDPLDMHDTMFGVPDRVANRFATVYGTNADGGLQAQAGDAYARYTDHHFATLSLSGSVPDYLRFAQMLLQKGELDGTRILGRKTVEMMARNWLPPEIPSINGAGPAATGWGLGVSVVIDDLALGRMGSVGSFGWSGAATTFFTVDPKEELTFVIMGQKMPNDISVRDKVENLIYQSLVD